MRDPRAHAKAAPLQGGGRSHISEGINLLEDEDDDENDHGAASISRHFLSAIGYWLLAIREARSADIGLSGSMYSVPAVHIRQTNEKLSSNVWRRY